MKDFNKWALFVYLVFSVIGFIGCWSLLTDNGDTTNDMIIKLLFFGFFLLLGLLGTSIVLLIDYNVSKLRK